MNLYVKIPSRFTEIGKKNPTGYFFLYLVPIFSCIHMEMHVSSYTSTTEHIRQLLI